MLHISTLIQKQPTDLFYAKRYSWRFHKIHRKTPVPESLFCVIVSFADFDFDPEETTRSVPCSGTGDSGTGVFQSILQNF